MITASVVAYHHSYSEIGKVLDCLLKSPVAKIYVVDNSSNDALRLLERISGRIRYIHSANIGYGGAHNIAMREAVEAGADYHVIVNPDIWFGEGVIEILAAYMDRHPDAGLVAPKTVYPDGETQYLCKLLPTPFDLILRRFLPAEDPAQAVNGSCGSMDRDGPPGAGLAGNFRCSAGEGTFGHAWTIPGEHQTNQLI